MEINMSFTGLIFINKEGINAAGMIEKNILRPMLRY